MSSITLSNGVKIHAIQTGTVAIKELQRNGQGHSRRSFARIFADRDWTEPLPILAWLIEHPEGLIVIDTGETARTGERGYFTPWQPYFRLGVREWVQPAEEIGPQLRALGFSPADVRWVVLTHFHTDHAGGLANFPDSEIVATNGDYQLARGLLGKARGFLPQHWPDWFAPTLIEPGDTRFGPFAASTTLTAAGDVHLLPTPGHTPGHLSVALEDGDDVFFFAADASYTERLMLDGVVDGVSPDPALARETLGRIQELVTRRPTVYLPTHDPESVARLTERRVVSGTPARVTP
jgi:N-acyl homoserine lactone hydrolase